MTEQQRRRRRRPVQVVEHQHFITLSEDNRVKIVPVAPTRGLIFDRKGEILALAGCDLLTISPSLLKELQESSDEVTPKLTIGLDAGVGIDASLSTGMESPVNAWLAFLRYPIWVGEGGNRFAAQIGAGTQTEPDYGQQARLRPGLSWGRGFESRWGGGWFGIEASAEYRFKSEDFAFKADYTAGIKPSEKWMLIFQLQTGRYGAEDTIVRLAPSVVRKMGKRMHLQLGGIASVAGDDALGLKFATWFEF